LKCCQNLLSYYADIDLTSALKLDTAPLEDSAAAAVPAVSNLIGSLTAGREAVLLFTDLSVVRSKLHTRRCSSLGKIIVRREEEI